MSSLGSCPSSPHGVGVVVLNGPILPVDWLFKWRSTFQPSVQAEISDRRCLKLSDQTRFVFSKADWWNNACPVSLCLMNEWCLFFLPQRMLHNTTTPRLYPWLRVFVFHTGELGTGAMHRQKAYCSAVFNVLACLKGCLNNTLISTSVNRRVLNRQLCTLTCCYIRYDADRAKYLVCFKSGFWAAWS